jgi:hypothetical protein
MPVVSGPSASVQATTARAVKAKVRRRLIMVDPQSKRDAAIGRRR